MNRLEALGLLAGGLAHDFNNMLTGILGNINIALEHSEPGSQVHQRLVEAEKGSLLAKDLTDKLLTFARGGSPQRRLASIEELIREHVCLLVTGSSTTCRCTFPADLWPVMVNEVLIVQAMTNLLINANQAMDGKGEIRITAENTIVEHEGGLPLESGRYVKISFSDTGPGIEKEILPRIFDPYFTTRPSGTGLGLAIVYSTIRQHDGYVTVESRKGKGTIFHIYLPATAGKRLSPRDH